MEKEVLFGTFDAFLISQMGFSLSGTLEQQEKIRKEAYHTFLNKIRGERPASFPTIRRWFGIRSVAVPAREQIFRIAFSLGCNVWNSLIAYAFDMLQTNPKSLADGELWDEAYRIFLALQILGATLVSVFFMINFFKETTDIKHGMTMEASIQFFIKLALVDAVFLNLTNILVFLIEIEQAFFGIIVPEDAASLVIRVGDDWEMSGSGLIFGNLFGLVFLFICLGGAVITLWTVYRVFLKLFFYMAVAPLALSTYAGPHEIGHTGSSWVRTFLCALFEMTGIMLMMRLGTILINAGGLFPTASEDILGGMLGSQGWEGLQAILGILIITGSVSGTDAMVRRAFGF